MDHIPDLFAALEHATTVISGPSSSVQYALPLHDFRHWVVSRCHARIRHRFLTARKECEVAPWDVMLTWSPSPEDAQKIKHSLINVPVPLLAAFEPFNLVPPVEHPGSLIFDGSTIAAWIQCLAKYLILADSSLGNNRKPKVDNIPSLEAALTVIHFLLGLEQIKNVFSSTSLPNRFRPLDLCSAQLLPL